MILAQKLSQRIAAKQLTQWAVKDYANGMNKEAAAKEIRTAFHDFTSKTGREWMSMSQAAGWAGLSKDELHTGIRHLARTDPACLIEPEADQRSLTSEDRDMAPTIGGEAKHLIRWE